MAFGTLVLSKDNQPLNTLLPFQGHGCENNRTQFTSTGAHNLLLDSTSSSHQRASLRPDAIYGFQALILVRCLRVLLFQVL